MKKMFFGLIMSMFATSVMAVTLGVTAGVERAPGTNVPSTFNVISVTDGNLSVQATYAKVDRVEADYKLALIDGPVNVAVKTGVGFTSAKSAHVTGMIQPILSMDVGAVEVYGAYKLRTPLDDNIDDLTRTASVGVTYPLNDKFNVGAEYFTVSGDRQYNGIMATTAFTF